MNFEEFLISIKFGLQRRYKIKQILTNDEGMRIDFKNGFCCGFNLSTLEEMNYEKGFTYLCDAIEKMYMEKLLA